MTVRRRTFLGYAGALAAVSVIGGASRASDVDVIVVGAGAAGIAAARTLREQGLMVTVVEAAGRIGGRVHTDTSIFGEPYDIGAHWLHVGRLNPFVRYGRENGFDVYETPDTETLYVGDREATVDEYASYESALSTAYETISRAGRRGRDISALEALSEVGDLGPWGELAHMTIGAWSMGKDLGDFSCVDWWSGESGQDWFCREGFGALWSHSARDVPVELSTPATAVDWSGDGVRVETPSGTLRARACVVTVSTGVLAAERIRFEPALPVRKQEAFHGISMGLYNHIAFRFRRNVFGTGHDEYLLYKLDRSPDPYPRGFGLLTNIGGRHLSYGDVGGGMARELEDAGPAATKAFGLAELRRMFGNAIDKELTGIHATAWGRNPLTRGSYASAAPGSFPMRAALREPIGERIWFAGEACSPDLWAMVAGAHTSGISAARDLARVLAD